MDFHQLKQETADVAAQAYRPGAAAKHFRQADSYIRFCGNYGLRFINREPTTLTYYITHLYSIFNSSKSTRNYVSVAKFLHKPLGLVPVAFDNFYVSSLLRAADLTM